MNDASSSTIKVMLADDSAVIRGALSRILEVDPDIEIIDSVANGEVAVRSATKHQPDVMLLDIEMPVMDGLTALPEIMKASPKTKVIMFSSLTEKGAKVTIRALALGAVECIVKPSSTQAVGQGSEFQQHLLNLIKSLCNHKSSGAVRQSAVSAPAPAAPAQIALRGGAYKGIPSVVAIGSSTGGPNALFEVLKNCKGINIPILLTQHMPATFTKILAQHITEHTGIPASEGEQGMKVERGHVYVAPGGFHMKVVKNDTGLEIKIDDGPPENYCKPSVEPMFRSAIELFNNRVLGVILTGMGNDGINAGKLLSDCGAQLIAQDEATSVVWGMPGAVAKAGYCTQVLPLDQIGPKIKMMVTG